jgi:hypothetical protein
MLECVERCQTREFEVQQVNSENLMKLMKPTLSDDGRWELASYNGIYQEKSLWEMNSLLTEVFCG